MFTYNTCANCHHEIVEHLKAASSICNECVMNGTKEKPFLNWKAVEKEDADG